MPKGSLSPFTAFYGVAIEMARRRHMRYGRMPTLVELIALLGVVGFLLALCLPSSSERVAAAIVRRSEHFQPGAQDRQRPSEALVATNVDVTGVWSVRRRLQRSSLEITGHRSGDLDVAFSTGGCLGSCRLARKGIFADGALTLNAAVAEYLGVEYQTLFAVRVEGQDYLVPAPFVDEFQRGLSSDLQSVVDRPAIDFYAYRRDPGN